MVLCLNLDNLSFTLILISHGKWSSVVCDFTSPFLFKKESFMIFLAYLKWHQIVAVLKNLEAVFWCVLHTHGQWDFSIFFFFSIYWCMEARSIGGEFFEENKIKGEAMVFSAHGLFVFLLTILLCIFFLIIGIVCSFNNCYFSILTKMACSYHRKTWLSWMQCWWGGWIWSEYLQVALDLQNILSKIQGHTPLSYWEQWCYFIHLY